MKPLRRKQSSDGSSSPSRRRKSARLKSTAEVGKEATRRAKEASGQPRPLTSKPVAPDSLSGGVVDNPKCELPEAIRIVVVDDHPLFRHGLVQLLNSDDGFSVCGEASSAP